MESTRAHAGMQVLWKTTSDRYIADRAWIGATLQACPFHPEGGCGVAGPGSYPRVSPPRMRIPRFLCPVANRSISLLPEFMAYKLTGTLAGPTTFPEAAAFTSLPRPCVGGFETTVAVALMLFCPKKERISVVLETCLRSSLTCSASPRRITRTSQRLS